MSKIKRREDIADLYFYRKNLDITDEQLDIIYSFYLIVNFIETQIVDRYVLSKKFNEKIKESLMNEFSYYRSDLVQTKRMLYRISKEEEKENDRI